MKQILLILTAILYLCSNISAAEKVYEYGFEDWTGDADTTPGYFSSTSYTEHWETHELSTQVVASEDPDCNSAVAYEGNYYFHQNFFEGSVDPCLGTQPNSVNPHTNIGANLSIPSDPKSNFDIASAISSDTMTIRFYFRTTGDWPNAVTNAMKFIRVYGADSVSSSMILISDDGTSFDITDHPHPDNPAPGWSDYHNIFAAPINWNDGQWHSVVMVVERLNDMNTAPNLRVSAWWDDWDMQDPADGSAEVYVDGFGSHSSHIALFVNWGATFPSSDMGIDMDKLEIWDGIAEAQEPNDSSIIFSDDFEWSGALATGESGYGWVSTSWEKLDFGGNGDNGGCARVLGGNPLSIPIPEGHLELYVRFYAKVSDSTAGQKWLKVFGQRDGTTYTNTTFGRTYETGLFSAVSYGADCISCDTQTTLNYPGGRWVPESEWTYYEAHIKFAEGPQWNNGVVEVWYGDEQKMSITNVNNRNSAHDGLNISYVSLSEYSSMPDEQVGYMYIDDIVISTEYIGPIEEGVNLSDVNRDGVVNIQDVILCVNIILGISDGSADVNMDEDTDVQDLIEIVNEILTHQS